MQKSRPAFELNNVFRFLLLAPSCFRRQLVVVGVEQQFWVSPIRYCRMMYDEQAMETVEATYLERQAIRRCQEVPPEFLVSLSSQ